MVAQNWALLWRHGFALSGEINCKFENVAVQCRCSSALVAKLDDQVSDSVRQSPRLSGAVSVLQHDAQSKLCEELSDRLQPFFPRFDRLLLQERQWRGWSHAHRLCQWLGLLQLSVLRACAWGVLLLRRCAGLLQLPCHRRSGRVFLLVVVRRLASHVSWVFLLCASVRSVSFVLLLFTSDFVRLYLC